MMSALARTTSGSKSGKNSCGSNDGPSKSAIRLTAKSPMRVGCMVLPPDGRGSLATRWRQGELKRLPKVAQRQTVRYVCLETAAGGFDALCSDSGPQRIEPACCRFQANVAN